MHSITEAAFCLRQFFSAADFKQRSNTGWQGMQLSHGEYLGGMNYEALIWISKTEIAYNNQCIIQVRHF